MLKFFLFSFFLFLLMLNLSYSTMIIHSCTEKDREAKNCDNLTDYLPVCGWFNSDIRCYSYPCAARFSSICAACQINSVEKVTIGRCPSSNIINA